MVWPLVSDHISLTLWVVAYRRFDCNDCISLKYNFSAEQRVSSNLIGRVVIYMMLYYVALFHKDWELPNSRIWLADMDIDHGLDFPIYSCRPASRPVMFWSVKCKTIDYFHQTILISVSTKNFMRKKLVIIINDNFYSALSKSSKALYNQGKKVKNTN